MKAGDHVIVETARGIEYGTVVEERRKIKEKCLGDELKTGNQNCDRRR